MRNGFEKIRETVMGRRRRRDMRVHVLAALLIGLVMGFGLATSTLNVPDVSAEGTLCAAGSYSIDGYEPCLSAPAGRYVDTDGATSATPCLQGYYQDETGQTSWAAAAGSYVDARRAALGGAGGGLSGGTGNSAYLLYASSGGVRGNRIARSAWPASTAATLWRLQTSCLNELAQRRRRRYYGGAAAPREP